MKFETISCTNYRSSYLETKSRREVVAFKRDGDVTVTVMICRLTGIVRNSADPFYFYIEVLNRETGTWNMFAEASNSICDFKDLAEVSYTDKLSEIEDAMDHNFTVMKNYIKDFYQGI